MTVMQENFSKLNRSTFENYVSERDHIKNVIFLKDSTYVPQDDLYIGKNARISYYKKEIQKFTDSVTYWVKITQSDGRSHSLKIEECGNGIAV